MKIADIAALSMIVYPINQLRCTRSISDNPVKFTDAMFLIRDPDQAAALATKKTPCLASRRRIDQRESTLSRSVCVDSQSHGRTVGNACRRARRSLLAAWHRCAVLPSLTSGYFRGLDPTIHRQFSRGPRLSCRPQVTTPSGVFQCDSRRFLNYV